MTDGNNFDHYASIILSVNYQIISLQISNKVRSFVQLYTIFMNFKPTKEFLQEAQVDESFIHRMQYGISTRQRVVRSTGLQQTDKTEDKKKVQVKKQPYTPPPQFRMPTPSLITLDQFKAHFQQLSEKQKSRKQIFALSIDIYYNIYRESIQEGGLLYVSSIGSFPSIVKKVLLFCPRDQIKEELTAQLIQKIRQLLYSIQFINSNPNQQIKIYELSQISFVSKQQLRANIKDKNWGLSHFDYDLTLFQEGAEAIGIDKYIFNLDYMCEHYKKQLIDIRIQNPLDYGFKPAKLKNKSYSMLLGDYRFYQLNYRSVEGMKDFKHLDQLGKGQIFFGVNFEPADQMLNKQMKKYVENTFFDFHGDFDMMSYLDTDVPGCSLPQMYFKTSGCWTGGHQENLNMSALNINHGPDQSQWYTLDLKYVEKLRKELNETYGTDLYLSEGLWYQKIQWFMTRGYPVKRFLQRKDDIVVTGPGTLHWVRSFGTAIQTSWNMMPKSYDQFYAAFQRHKVNKQIMFHKSDTIPLKSIILKYLNHERRIMPEKILMLCINQLQQWYKQEITLVEQLFDKIKKKSQFYLRDLQSFCTLCKQQVLVFFLPAPSQFQKGISCLQCYFKAANKVGFNFEELYFKRQTFWIQQLIQLCKDKQKNMSAEQEITQLCKGIHVGKIQGNCSVAKPQTVVLPTYNDEFDKTSALRQIYLQQPQLLEIHTYIDSIFKRNKDALVQITTLLKQNDRIKPINSNQCKMACQKQEGQMEPEKINQLTTRDCQTQTSEPYPQITPTLHKEDGEVEQNPSKSKQKKKKKHKQKSKHKKKKDNSPQFSTDSERKKRKGSGSVESNFNAQQEREEGRRTYYNDRQRNYDNYNNEGMQGNKNYGHRNYENDGRQMRDRNNDGYRRDYQRERNNDNYDDGNRNRQNNYNRDRGGFRGGRGRGGFNRDHNFRDRNQDNYNRLNNNFNKDNSSRNNNDFDNTQLGSKVQDAPDQY